MTFKHKNVGDLFGTILCSGTKPCDSIWKMLNGAGRFWAQSRHVVCTTMQNNSTEMTRVWNEGRRWRHISCGLCNVCITAGQMAAQCRCCGMPMHLRCFCKDNDIICCDQFEIVRKRMGQPKDHTDADCLCVPWIWRGVRLNPWCTSSRKVCNHETHCRKSSVHFALT